MDAPATSAHQNDAKVHGSSSLPILDAFDALNRFSGARRLNSELTKAWKEDPELTLRLIWHFRSIHEGKSDKYGFYRAFGWLYKHHPRTAILNLPMLVTPCCRDKARPNVRRPHGYWKDLLNVLALATTDGLHSYRPPFLHPPRMKQSRLDDSGQRKARENSGSGTNEEQKANAKERRARQAEEKYANLVTKLEDKKYRALYVAVARLFSEQLLKDLRLLVEIQGLDPTDTRARELTREISLAGKWAPTGSLSHDRHTNITSAIALLIHHSRDQVPTFVFPSALEGLAAPSVSTNRAFLSVLRSYMQRWIFTPLRAITHVTEPLMTAGKWTSIQYHRVPSLCMKHNTVNFYLRDPTGVEKYERISGATLLPHELAMKAVELGDSIKMFNRISKPYVTKRQEIEARVAETRLRVVETHWDTMIGRLRGSALEGSLAICKATSSMGSFLARPLQRGRPDPIVPAAALSLVITQLAKPPFDRGCIMFSEDPQFVQVGKGVGMGLYESLMHITNTGRGLGATVNFEKVFLGLLLPLAKEKRIPREDMPKRLIVFSDASFDHNTYARDIYGYGQNRSEGEPWQLTWRAGETWQTSYDVVKAHFEEAGYEVPQIVLWDLLGYDTAFVGYKEREGVVVTNGLSSNMTKVFLGEELEVAVESEGKQEKEKEAFHPVNEVKEAVMKECFDGLVVSD
ncbi:hypothetical protein V5O48_009503 [Marasmius crinis-equi]|uniref:TROVE domain-containing protein n=1 Tax=Marasmius crinis-equi TaxID=585013 RepID=A0ABR3FBH7_9AGAR